MYVKPRISVVIPHYNQERYLAYALESVAEQELLPLEIIVVDDASPSNEVEKVVAQSTAAPLIKLIRQPQRRGVAATRNRGIREARGDYIAFLDADDFWLRGHLLLFALCCDHHETVVPFYTDETVLFTKYNIPDDGLVWINRYCSQTDYFKLAVNNAWTVNSSSVIFHRRVFDRIGLFDEQLPVFEDIDFWIRAGKHYLLYHQWQRRTAVRLDTEGSLSKNRSLYREQVLRYFFDKHLAGEPEGNEKRFIHQNILGSILDLKYHGLPVFPFLMEYLDTEVLNRYELFKLRLPAPLFRFFRRLKQHPFLDFNDSVSE